MKQNKRHFLRINFSPPPLLTIIELRIFVRDNQRNQNTAIVAFLLFNQRPRIRFIHFHTEASLIQVSNINKINKILKFEITPYSILHVVH